MTDAMQQEQEAIPVQVVDGCVAIPRGMKLITVHEFGGSMLAHVKDWTSKKQFDNNQFDLYPLSEARKFVQEGKLNGLEYNQDWWDSFGDPTKEAMIFSGEWDIRDRV
jgi:hypothetical protein